MLVRVAVGSIPVALIAWIAAEFAALVVLLAQAVVCTLAVFGCMFALVLASSIGIIATIVVDCVIVIVIICVTVVVIWDNIC
jgi:hypothetical protein